MTLSRSMIRNMNHMQDNCYSKSSTHPTVTLTIDEHHGRTYAKVELQWGSAHLAGLGVAYRHPADHLVRKTGQELATARALSDLAEQVTALSRASN
jgi:hypothetical protein